MLKAKEAADCKWVWTKGAFHWICYADHHHDVQANVDSTALQGNQLTRPSLAEDCRWVWTRRDGFRFICYGGGHHDDVQTVPQDSDSVIDLSEIEPLQPPPAHECKWLWTRRGGFRWVCY